MKKSTLFTIIIIVIILCAVSFFGGLYVGKQNAQAAFWARNQPSIYAVLECEADQASGTVSCYGAIQK